jgi:hypothetical protein
MHGIPMVIVNGTDWYSRPIREGCGRTTQPQCISRYGLQFVRATATAREEFFRKVADPQKIVIIVVRLTDLLGVSTRRV